jgi:hypothetical protein
MCFLSTFSNIFSRAPFSVPSPTATSTTPSTASSTSCACATTRGCSGAHPALTATFGSTLKRSTATSPIWSSAPPRPLSRRLLKNLDWFFCYQKMLLLSDTNMNKICTHSSWTSLKAIYWGFFFILPPKVTRLIKYVTMIFECSALSKWCAVQIDEHKHLWLLKIGLFKFNGFALICGLCCLRNTRCKK